MQNINAKKLNFKQLNEQIRSLVSQGEKEIRIENINGQRYIASGLKSDVKLTIEGVPGNDLGSFMNGPEIIVHGNGQDVVANTMNDGRIIIHGNAGDVLGYAMRNGELYIKGNAGYRIGIHMKAYKELLPVIIIGGSVGDFLGEYMAGGVIIVLGLDGAGQEIAGNYIGTGMHGGTIYIRGKVEKYQLGKEVGIADWSDADSEIMDKYLARACREFQWDCKTVREKPFTKLVPATHRPYGKLYAY